MKKQMGTANFPELTDKVFIVNAPWAAVKGWNLVGACFFYRFMLFFYSFMLFLC